MFHRRAETWNTGSVCDLVMPERPGRRRAVMHRDSDLTERGLHPGVVAGVIFGGSGPGRTGRAGDRRGVIPLRTRAIGAVVNFHDKTRESLQEPATETGDLHPSAAYCVLADHVIVPPKIVPPKIVPILYSLGLLVFDAVWT
jgi:hypothetical protein